MIIPSINMKSPRGEEVMYDHTTLGVLHVCTELQELSLTKSLLLRRGFMYHVSYIGLPSTADYNASLYLHTVLIRHKSFYMDIIIAQRSREILMIASI